MSISIDVLRDLITTLDGKDDRALGHFDALEEAIRALEPIETLDRLIEQEKITYPIMAVERCPGGPRLLRTVKSTVEAVEQLVRDLADNGITPDPPEDAKRVLVDALYDGKIEAIRAPVDAAEGWRADIWVEADRCDSKWEWVSAGTAEGLLAKLREKGILPPAGGEA